MRALKDHYKRDVHGVISSALDGIDLSALNDLQKVCSNVSSLAATPLEIQERHEAVAIRAAVHYELGRAAIPVHYQNLRDKLEREYNFASLRDSQVHQILLKSPSILELREHVYQSKFRFRDTQGRDILKHWGSLLASRYFDDVHDLPVYCSKLNRWLEPLSTLPLNGFPEISARLYVQLIDTQTASVVYPSETQNLLAKQLYAPAAEYLQSTSPFDLIEPFLTPVDEKMLGRLNRANEIRIELLSKPNGRQAILCLQRFANLWIEYIRDQNLRGQEQKWRGWYLVPEHGPITIDKLWELQRIIRKLSEMSQGDSLLIDTSETGISNAVALLDAGRVRYRQNYARSKKRDLFIRQQKNYLVRLGLVTEPASSHISITSRGQSWWRISSDHELRKQFKSIMEEIRWTWCNMPFFVFAKQVVKECDGYITYRELSNWLIHAFDASQLEEMIVAINLYRSLPEYQRHSINDYIEDRLRSQLDKYMSSAAFGHYRTKVRDLMQAFVTTGDFYLKTSGDNPKLYLTKR